MNVLVVCQSVVEADGLRYAISHLSRPKHSYKVVVCGAGEANAMTMTSLEVNDAVTKYDVIVSAGWGFGPFHKEGDVVMPSQCSAIWDIDFSKYAGKIESDLSYVYKLETGVDKCGILSGESYPSDESIKACVEQFGKGHIFDTISHGVAVVADDYGIPFFVVKKVYSSADIETGVNEFMSQISYIESLG